MFLTVYKLFVTFIVEAVIQKSDQYTYTSRHNNRYEVVKGESEQTNRSESDTLGTCHLL